MSQKSILIVEDEAPVAEALLRRLRARGYAPEHAGSRADALEIFDVARPDLVVLSLSLADDAGLRLCRDVRARQLGALVPILLVGTGREEVRSVGEAIAAGADHYFRKPEGLEDLISKVSTYIGPGGQSLPRSPTPTRQPSTTPAPVSASQQPEPVADWALEGEETSLQPPEALPLPTPPSLPDERRQWQPARPPKPDEGAEWDTVLHPGRPVELERRGLGEIIAAGVRVHLTGRVEVASAGVLRRIFFEDGRPVFADSSSQKEDLASWLAAEGMIGRSALGRARQRAAQLGTSPEEVLIEAGFLQPEEVYRALRGHVVARILSVFGLEAGEAVVVKGGPRPLDPVDLGMHPGRLLLDGVRRKYGRLRLYRAFGTASAVPRPRPGVDAPPGLVLRPDEEAVWKCCDGRRTAVEVAHAARTGEVDALGILYGLAILDLIEAPGGRRIGVLPPLEPEVIARAGAPRTADQMPGFAELVSAKLAEVHTADYFQILGVPRGCTGAEVQAAWEVLRQRFDPHRVRRDAPLWHQVVEIAAVLDDAHAILGGERLRRRYERALR